MAQSKRLFAAVNIHPAESFLNIFNQIKQALRNERITWINTSSIHLTIKFFGETFTDQIPTIDTCLKAATDSFQQFELEVKNTGMFGSKYDPRVIWFGIEDGNQLQQLFLRVSAELKTIGILPDRQNFVPHLTIGRIKELRDKKGFQRVLDQYKEHASGKQIISQMILYESILRREGPLYIPLHKYNFTR